MPLQIYMEMTRNHNCTLLADILQNSTWISAASVLATKFDIIFSKIILVIKISNVDIWIKMAWESPQLCVNVN